MALVGIGATIFAVAISITVYGVIRMLLSRRAPIPPEAQAVDWHAGSSGIGAVPAWNGPVSVAALVIAMYAFTIIAFHLEPAMARLPGRGPRPRAPGAGQTWEMENCRSG